MAESCFDTNGIGAEVEIAAVSPSDDPALNTAAALFGESASRVIVSVSPDDVTAVLERAAAAAVPAHVIGETGGNRVRLSVAGATAIDLSVDEAERLWSTAIGNFFAKRVA